MSMSLKVCVEALSYFYLYYLMICVLKNTTIILSDKIILLHSYRSREVKLASGIPKLVECYLKFRQLILPFPD